jgi:hypothetical protein
MPALVFRGIEGADGLGNRAQAARPILWHNRSGTCWHPYVKGYTPMVNSIYNGNRFEDIWLDK